MVNALAATPSGGHIQLEAQLINGPQPREVEIIVADSGSGLGPAEQEHLFEKFRLSRQISEGSGLGLYICKTLVEANHGRIWVESQAGRGAAFHLALPAAASSGESPEG